MVMQCEHLENGIHKDILMKNRTLTLKSTDYQPSKAELEKKVRIKTTPENLAKAMVQDVKIKHSPDAKQAECYAGK